MHDPSPRRAVILAAGLGSRLSPHTARIPKPLVPLGDQPIVAYTLAGLALNGLRDVVIVTGFGDDAVRTALRDGSRFGVSITYVANPRYHLGASYSLLAAREATRDEDFLLLMSDHLLSAGLIAALLECPPGVTAVAADYLRGPGRPDPELIAEATRLRIDSSGRVLDIGKDLPSWSALDTGAFRVTPEVWAAAAAAPEDCDLSTIFRQLARTEALRATDVSGCFWYDVDTADDLLAATDLLADAAHGL